MNLHHIFYPNDPVRIPETPHAKRISWVTIVDREEERCGAHVSKRKERIAKCERGTTAATYEVTERNRDLPCGRCGVSKRFISADGKCRTTMCQQCQARKNDARNARRKARKI